MNLNCKIFLLILPFLCSNVVGQASNTTEDTYAAKIAELITITSKEKTDNEKAILSRKYSDREINFALCYDGLDKTINIFGGISNGFMLINEKPKFDIETLKIINKDSLNCHKEFSQSVTDVMKNLFPDDQSLIDIRDLPSKHKYIKTERGKFYRIFYLDCDSRSCLKRISEKITNEIADIEYWLNHYSKMRQLNQIQEEFNNQKNLKIAQEEERKVLKEHLALISNADKNDVIAMVLNYSSGYGDNGGSYIWIKDKDANCKYLEYSTTSGIAIRSINLDLIDPQNIKIVQYEETQKTSSSLFLAGKFKTPDTYRTFNTQSVNYMGKSLFKSENLDMDRLKRGWDLIFSKYCKGNKKEF